MIPGRSWHTISRPASPPAAFHNVQQSTVARRYRIYPLTLSACSDAPPRAARQGRNGYLPILPLCRPARTHSGHRRDQLGPFGSWKFTPAGENKIAGNGSPAPGLYKNSLVAPAGRTPVYIGNDNTITAEPTPGYWLLPTTISGQTTADNGTLPSM